MENNELKKVTIKNCTCYYFNDIIKIEGLSLIFYWMKNHMKIFWFMTFHTKLCLVQNHYVLDLMK